LMDKDSGVVYQKSKRMFREELNGDNGTSDQTNGRNHRTQLRVPFSQTVDALIPRAGYMTVHTHKITNKQ